MNLNIQRNQCSCYTNGEIFFESMFQNKIDINQHFLQKIYAVLVFWGY